MAVPIPLVDLGQRDASKMFRHLPHVFPRPSWLLDELFLEVLDLLRREDLVLGLLSAEHFKGLRSDSLVKIHAGRLVLHRCNRGGYYLLILLGLSPGSLNLVQVVTHREAV